MSEKWICSCGAECYGKFCTKCGRPKPEAPAGAPAEEGWVCPNCGTACKGKFCTKCGTAKPEDAAPPVIAEPEPAEVVEEAPEAPEEVAEEAAPAVEETVPVESVAEAVPASEEVAPEESVEEVPAAPAPEAAAIPPQAPVPAAAPIPAAAPAPEKKKSKKKLWIILGSVIGAVVIAAVVVCLFLFVFPGRYVTNPDPEVSQQEVPEGYKLLVDEEQDLAFLYQKPTKAETEEYGAFVYLEEKGETPYIQVNRKAGKTSPDKYFKAYIADRKNSEPDLNYSEIKEVEAGSKTLYMISAVLPDDNLQQHFIEIYKDFYITYDSVGIEETSNTPLYETITTLMPSADAYAAPKAAEPTEVTNDIGNFSIVVPGEYEINEFTSGLFAQAEDAGLFAAYFNTDAIGSIIYDKQDFAAMSARVDEYVATILGVEAIEIGSGTEKTMNGASWSIYPTEVTLEDGTEGTGELYMTDAENLGIYLLYYYAEDGAGKERTAEGQDFAKSMKILGAPNISDYTVIDTADHGLGKLCVKSELIGKTDLQDSALAISNPEGTATVIVEFLEGTTMDNVVAKTTEAVKVELRTTAEVVPAELPKEGRFNYKGYQIIYDAKGTKRTCLIGGLEDSNGNLLAFIYDVADADLEWADAVVENIIWSWEVRS